MDTISSDVEKSAQKSRPEQKRSVGASAIDLPRILVRFLALAIHRFEDDRKVFRWQQIGIDEPVGDIWKTHWPEQNISEG